MFGLRHVMRFVEKAVGRGVAEPEAVESLERAARELGMKAHELDWAICEYMRAVSKRLATGGAWKVTT